jgi:pyruvate/2-oxoglutarate dehydrogenase complex dihydrolipoamide dehydrogenase (E3) component
MNRNYDAIVIGAGQAGPPLAMKLANAGMKVAIIERKYFGGTCVNTGCIPSKTLIASAYVAHLARRSKEFGIISSGDIFVDMAQVKARLDSIVLPLREKLEKSLRETENCTVYHDHAKFENSHTIRVGNELLEAKQIFINVGARAAVPLLPGLEQIKYFTNSSIFAVDFLPKHLIIIGGSYIGLEFAQMYCRFGSQVTVVEKGERLLQHEDPDISEAIKQILEKENINIRLNAECFSLDKKNNDIVMKLNCSDGEKEIIGTHLLLALGRKPNTDDLGLDKVGIETDDRGFIKVNDQLQTNIENIWALGECNGKGAFTHTSYNDYEIIADNLLHHKDRRVSDRITAYNLYIDPPLGRVGITETEARKLDKHFSIATWPMSKVKRAIIKGETQGFMKAVVDSDTQQILGAAILGTSGDEVIHCILDVMYAKAPYTLLTNAVHIHPTVSELVPTLLQNFKS